MEARKDYHKPNLGWIMQGYRWICLPDGHEVLEHRHFMEQHLGRKLHIDEVVHHKNHNKIDNRLENLEVMYRTAHTACHRQIKPIDRTCEVCGTKFTKPARRNSQYIKTCSSVCEGKQLWMTRRANAA